MRSVPNVAIVGGGIGGLTAALALRQEGIEAHVYEQKSEFTEVGVGLGLDTNALRLIHRLGLGGEIEKIGHHHSALEYRWGPDGRLLYEFGETRELGELNVHRGQFLRVVERAVPTHQLHAGMRCVRVDDQGDKIHLGFADGSSLEADAVIGADGIRSVVRSNHFASAPRFSGTVAYRGLVPSQRLAGSSRDLERMVFWLGPRRHILTYPIAGGSLVNIVAFVETGGEWIDENWIAAAEAEEVDRLFSDWDPSVRRLIQNLDRTTRWALFDCEPLPAWSVGRVTLLGDAAHAMLPHHGQGASQAIEDAVVLARCLSRATNATVADWLGRYERVRKPRAERVQQLSRRTGEAYATSDPEEQIRLVKAGLQNHGEWLWNHDADQEFDEALRGVGA